MDALSIALLLALVALPILPLDLSSRVASPRARRAAALRRVLMTVPQAACEVWAGALAVGLALDPADRHRWLKPGLAISLWSAWSVLVLRAMTLVLRARDHAQGCAR